MEQLDTFYNILKMTAYRLPTTTTYVNILTC